ncbi:hypothetical protein [Aeromicrobium sp. Leaf291]|uniref:hypothetical protein n=1 Tax=Aeromicrobium sp. Leaf291 TaxID=1736325 RepID=UPI0006F1CC68|nr:hypothetical protein [Aeromicrobium sp. Leaf291]KQP83728.1 hypothetical protein ASF35_01755 [Aeromicrobium sp. Leaf291]
MTTANLTKTRSVLDLVPNALSDDLAVFASHDEDTGQVLRSVRFSQRDHDDMGRPEQVTVTIEPGDLLR